jgi:hypothetical protein
LEAVACINHDKDSPIAILRQINKYYKEGFPANYSLHETTIMVIEPKKYLVSELRKVWWQEIISETRRDQLSLAYARWKTSTEIGLLGHWKLSRTRNPFSNWVGHKHERYINTRFTLNLNWFPVKWLCKKLIFEMRRRR